MTDLFVMATPTITDLPVSATFLREIGDEVEYQVFCATTDNVRPQSAPCDFLHFATVEVGSEGMTLDVTRGSTILEISSAIVISVTGSATCTFMGSDTTSARCSGELVSRQTTEILGTYSIFSTTVTETMSTTIGDISTQTLRLSVSGENLPTQTSSARKLAQRATLACVIAILGGIAMI
ncbi:hypothetical protein MMYC01_204256 [Madurella mycetomatis]|uniref:Uncharacterized protein n=1 Tax=Madurella mycetomatis TaxID=100816 RepID=A0A175W9S5_9PEZI|nr:hypothetical protein MMYC01_204256 [Madurella mycetomatis]